MLRAELSEVLEPVPFESEYSLAHKLRNHAWSVLSGAPYIFYEYGDRRFGQELRRAVAHAQPNMAHLDSLDLYRWIPSLPDIPIACTHHSVESELLRLEADHSPNPVARQYIRHQANLVEKIERKLCAGLGLNVMTSELDGERLRGLAPGAKTTVVPNGVDVDFFRPSVPELVVPGRVAFLGPTFMFPNRDAVDSFLADSWPLVREHFSGSTLHLIGKNSVEEKTRFESHPDVTCNGHVPDVRPHFAEAAVSVVPIRVGGGTRLKILDSWSMGKAVVSTSVGCEGLKTRDGHNILIRDDPKDFAAAVVQVLRDPDLRARLGRAARMTAEEHYSWRAIGQKLVGSYNDLLSSEIVS
jgi:glycosyltransferase involved in cell wall biosynthesis